MLILEANYSIEPHKNLKLELILSSLDQIVKTHSFLDFSKNAALQ